MNNFDQIAVVILAAGLGKRMNSELPKVMIACDGAPIIDYVVTATLPLAAERTIIVTGHKRELVEEHLSSRYSSKLHSLRFAFQQEQRGTGDAVKAALSSLEGFTGPVLIIYGDTPLLTGKTLKDLLLTHQREAATITLLSVKTLFPAQYGRIIRNQKGSVASIREFKDCSEDERLVNEINAGIYVVDSAFLRGAVEQLKNDNAQKEYYFTDVVEQASKEGQNLSCLTLYELTEIQGVNNRIELAETAQKLKTRRINQMIESGVQFLDPSSVEISAEVQIEPGATIGAHTVISGKSRIHSGAIVEGFSVLQDTCVAAGSTIRHFVHAVGAQIGPNCQIGPFARLREETVLDGENRIGNFVETKKAHLEKGAKANHLTYLGDCSVGEQSNIGAGTITCNYDGQNKSKTTIGKNSFIGSNSVLVAPVVVGDGAYVGAGSTITKDVASDSLAISRTPQSEIPGWAAKRRQKKSIK